MNSQASWEHQRLSDMCGKVVAIFDASVVLLNTFPFLLFFPLLHRLLSSILFCFSKQKSCGLCQQDNFAFKLTYVFFFFFLKASDNSVGETFALNREFDNGFRKQYHFSELYSEKVSEKLSTSPFWITQYLNVPKNNTGRKVTFR